MIIPYNPKLKLLARKLRKESTFAEVILWRELKKKKVLGYDFHIQKPINEYIVDFYCPRLKLAIEVDGATHGHEQIYQKDEIKQRRLEELGIQILRFADGEVKKNLEGVMKIEDYIQNISTPRPARCGAPLSRGDK